MTLYLTRRTALGLTIAGAAGLACGRALAGPVAERADLAGVFTEQGVAGTFVLYEPATDHLTAVNAKRAQAPLVPASTFKIANSIIALETAVVKNENEVIPYGGKPQPFKQWEKDMPMREAIALSAVPIYQELAGRVGHARYREWLARLDYGNRRTGKAVDTFWLDGPLEISAVEQARFLAKLAASKLDASERAQAITRDIIRLETKDGATLYGKTGWQFSRKPQLGWWVGWVEKGGAVSAFAVNIDMANGADAPKRLAIGKALLGKLGVW
jgi:beta-lactamase class D